MLVCGGSRGWLERGDFVVGVNFKGWVGFLKLLEIRDIFSWRIVYKNEMR